jgi:DNA helicase IV
MALRMVARRSLDGRSFTILGDLAQATAPGAPIDWARTVASLGNPEGARVEELLVGYRVPRQIVEIANQLLAAASPGLPTTTSVREGDEDPVFRAVDGEAALLAEAVEEAAKVLARYRSVALIARSDRLPDLVKGLGAAAVPATPLGQPPAAGEVTVLAAAEAKGLEFDAVVVVEPGDFLGDRAGTALLYIALTRAVQHLAIVHTGRRPLAG